MRYRSMEKPTVIMVILTNAIKRFEKEHGRSVLEGTISKKPLLENGDVILEPNDQLSSSELRKTYLPED